MNQAVEALAQRAIREHWDFLPTAGSRIGLHEYDGRLPDFSAGRIRRRGAARLGRNGPMAFRIGGFCGRRLDHLPLGWRT